MESKPVQKSRVWTFVGISAAAIILFVINGMIVAKSPVQSSEPLAFNTVLSFLLAALSFGTAVVSNVSAYLNPASPRIARYVSPVLLVIVIGFILPFFMTLGTSVVNK